MGSGGSLTPTVMSPTMNFAVRPAGNGYITVEEANHVKLIPENCIVSDPRAYSKVATLPASPLEERPLPPEAEASAASTASTTMVVMSAKDLQVETKAPYKKVVTSLDGNSVTTSTMV